MRINNFQLYIIGGKDSLMYILLTYRVAQKSYSGR